jgi:tRNA threonylcarbamoyladenosine biosynthesis protein TsaE
MKKETHISHSEQDTLELGELFATKLKAGDIISLYGELGSGKTEFIKGICDYFEISDIVTSPTFTIMNNYYGTLNDKEVVLNHFDLYRIKSLEELENIGFSEIIYNVDTIKLIEWAEKADGILDKYSNYIINIKSSDEDENMRQFEIIDCKK